MTATAIDVRQAQAEIAAAWQKYQQVEKRGLEFGETVYRWREKFKAQGNRSGTGKGLLPILEQVGIPTSTAYWWINRYEVSVGLKAAPTPKELEDEEDDSYEPPTPHDRHAEDEDDDPELNDWNEEKLEEILEAARKREEKWRAAHPQELNSTSQITPDVLKAAEALVEMGYRVLAKSLHPDAGGSHEEMSKLNGAVTWLRLQIKQHAGSVNDWVGPEFLIAGSTKATV